MPAAITDYATSTWYLPLMPSEKRDIEVQGVPADWVMTATASPFWPHPSGEACLEVTLKSKVFPSGVRWVIATIRNEGPDSIWGFRLNFAWVH